MSATAKGNIEDIYALSPVQQGMFFHSALEPELAPYVGQGIWTIEGPLDVDLYERSWNLVAERNPILRTVFRQARKQPVQIVLQQRPVSLTVHDLRGTPADEQETAVHRAMEEDLTRPIDLGRGPLFRLLLFRFSDTRFKAAWSFHHIIMDGWTGGFIQSQLWAVYDALARTETPPPAEALPFKDFIVWLNRQDPSEALGYWERCLEDFSAPTPLPFDRRKRTVSGKRHAVRQLVLPEALGAALAELVREHRVTLTVLLQAAWAVLLSRYSGERDVVFGLTVSGRPLELTGVERIAGPFINTLPVRVRLEQDPRLLDLLDDVQRQTIDANHYGFVSLVEVQARSAVRPPQKLFESIFSSIVVDGGAARRGDIQLLPDGQDALAGRTNYDLAVDVVQAGRVHVAMSYVEDALDAATIDGMLAHLRRVLESMVSRPRARVSELESVPEEQRRRVLAMGRGAAVAEDEAWAEEQIARRAAEHPERVALMSEGEELSYGELDRRANRLANWLAKKGVGREGRVGILGRRGLGLWTTVLGVMRSGAAFVPLEPSDPEERLRRVVGAAGLKCLAVGAGLLERSRALVEGTDCEVFSWEEGAPWSQGEEGEPARMRAHGKDLAYVFYTSGSTGTPKGVMVERRGMSNHLRSKAEVLGLTSDDVVVQNAAHSFDVSVWQFLSALMVGGRVVIYGEDLTWDAAGMVSAVKRDGATVLETVPSFLELLLGVERVEEGFGGLRCLVSNAETLSVSLVRRWFDRCGGVKLANTWGATECADDVTVEVLTEPVGEEASRVGVGRPVRGTRVYVLDEELRPVGLGCAGEVAVGGVCVGRGYLGEAALTAERFVPDPLAEKEGERLYLSGDLARWTEEGALEFLGRRDGQVKVRGHRVEVGEVEGVLSEHPGVSQGVVELKQGRLAGYWVGEAGLASAELRRYLGQRLPGYMVPEALVHLDELPRTRSGKLDRRALPEPKWDEEREGYLAPRTPIEAQIAEVWQEVLGLERVGVHDNFFDLGGHSLKTIQVRSRLSQRFETEVPLKAVFEYQTVEAQARVVAALLEQDSAKSRRGISRLGERTHYALSHAQRRLWFLHRLSPEDRFYHSATHILLEGQLNRHALESAIAALVERHAMLRTSFGAVEAGPVQRISDDFRLAVPFHDVASLPAPEQSGRLRSLLVELANAPFDLEVPPVRALLIKLAEEQHLLALVGHHIIGDGWSGQIASRDLRELYGAACRGEAANLPELPLRYVDYAAWQNERIENGGLEPAERYWLARLGGTLPRLELPADHPEPAEPTFEMRVEALRSDTEVAAGLRRIEQERDATPFMVRLAVFEAFLSRVTGQEDILVGSPVAGRDHVDVEGLVGFFVNTIALRTGLGGDPTFVEIVQRIKQTCLEAYAHQEYPFDLLVQRLNPVRDPERFPILETFFATNPMDHAQVVEGLKIGEIKSGSRTRVLPAGRKLPVSLYLTSEDRADGELGWSFFFRAELFEAETAQRIGQQFARFLADLVRRPAVPLSQLALAAEPEETPVRAIPDRAEHPLSPSQRNLWFQSQLHAGRGVNNACVAVDLVGPLDSERLARAFETVVERQGTLRTVFSAPHGVPAQRVLASVVTECPLQDSSSEAPSEASVRASAEGFMEPAFDLGVGPLFRARLLRLAEDRHVLLLAFHQMVLDGLHWPQLLEEIGAAYDSLLRGQQPARTPLELQYTDFAAWQEARLKEGVFSSHAAYWRRQLRGPLPAMLLPADRQAASDRSFDLGVVTRQLAPEIVDSLGALRRKHRVSFFSIVLAAFEVLLHRLLGETDLLLAAPFATRPRELGQVLGSFSNVLPLRAQIDPRRTFVEHLRDVDRQLGESGQRKQFPLAEILKGAKVGRVANHPLFPVVVSRMPRFERTVGAMSWRSRFFTSRGEFDLWLAVAEGTRDLGLSFFYAGELFEAATISRVADSLEMLLARVGADPEGRISELEITSESERGRLAVEWNSTRRPYPHERSAAELFEEQARRRPDATAVVCGAHALSYRELETRANHVALRLRALGAGVETRVALCLERSVEMVVGLLGVLKAGAAYVPLDPSHPRARLALILEDARPLALLSTRESAAELPALGIPMVWLYEPLVGEAPAPLPRLAGPEDLAYVIFTSGSTGRPKGVCVRQRALTNCLSAMAREPGLCEHDVLLAVTTLSFDIASLELLLPLIVGGRVAVAERNAVADPMALAELIASTGATVMQATPATWRMLIDGGWKGAAGLKVICGGEALPATLAQELKARCGEVWNVYGPTETTIWSTTHRLEEVRETVPIGRPIDNTRAYVLDPRLGLAPIGAPAELYLGGDGLARGYLNRPELTAERFVPDPFAEEPGGRLYRTGDRVRWRSEGELEFLGRLDEQVKLRGFRIEPGEIERALVSHEAVHEAVVVAREDSSGQRRLVAYVVAAGGVVDPGALREHLKERLPEYMVPSALVALESIPLTPNGKVDRRALPEPDLRAGMEGYVAPRTEMERRIAEVWQQVLGVERVGVDDSFFDLGGHSLKTIQVRSRLQEALDVEVPLRVVFEHSTVADQARAVVELSAAGARAGGRIPRLRDRERHPLSPAQRRLWFLQRFDPASTFCNIVVPLVLEGPLDRASLLEAAQALVERHESLRTSFGLMGEEPVQQVLGDFRLEIPFCDLETLEKPERWRRATDLVTRLRGAPFDLETPPVRASLVRLGEQRHLLVLCAHHIVIDGWSQPVLARDLRRLYEVVRGGGEELPKLPVRYVDYAAWQNERIEAGALAAHEEYWLQRLGGELPELELPVDWATTGSTELECQEEILESEGWVDAQLRRVGDRCDATPFMVRLAMVKAFLARLTGQEDVVVGTPVAGRDRAELEGMVGMFVNTLALRTDLSGDPPFDEVVRRVKRTCVDAYGHQEYPFDLLVQRLNPARGTNRVPILQVVFVSAPPAATAEDGGLRITIGYGSGTTVRSRRGALGALNLGLTITYLEGTDGRVGWGFLYNPDRLQAADETDRFTRPFGLFLQQVANGV